MARNRIVQDYIVQDKGSDTVRDASRNINRSLSSVEDKSKSVTSSMSKSWTKLIGIIGAAGVGLAMKNMVLDTVYYADSLGKMSTRLGIATTELDKLNQVAQDSNVEFRTLGLGLQRMQRRLQEASQGTGVAKDTFKNLGLSVQELNRMAPDKIFLKIASALNKLPKGAQLAQGMKIFDSEAIGAVLQMLPTLNSEFDKLTSNFDAETVAAAESFTHEMGLLKINAQQLAAKAIPDLNAALKFLVEHIDAIVTALKALAIVLGTLALLKLGAIIQTWVMAFVAAGKAVAALGKAVAILRSVQITGLVITLGALLDLPLEMWLMKAKFGFMAMAPQIAIMAAAITGLAIVAYKLWKGKTDELNESLKETDTILKSITESNTVNALQQQVASAYAKMDELFAKRAVLQAKLDKMDLVKGIGGAQEAGEITEIEKAINKLMGSIADGESKIADLLQKQRDGLNGGDTGGIVPTEDQIMKWKIAFEKATMDAYDFEILQLQRSRDANIKLGQDKTQAYVIYNAAVEKLDAARTAKQIAAEKKKNDAITKALDEFFAEIEAREKEIADLNASINERIAQDTMDEFDLKAQKLSEYYEEAQKTYQDLDKLYKWYHGEMVKNEAARSEASMTTLEKWAASAKSTYELVQDWVIAGAEAFSSGLTDGIFDFIDGTKSAGDAFRDFASSFLKEIAKMILQQTILNALKNSFGAGSALGSIIGTLAGARANGGPVSGGQSYLVGERGPEIFTPNSGGNITPNGGVGGISVVNNITVESSGGNAQKDKEQANIIAMQAEKQIIQVIGQQKRYGGLLYNG